MSFNLEIDGQTWYFTSQAAMKECEFNPSRLNQYKKAGLASTTEENLQSVQIGNFSDSQAEGLDPAYDTLNGDSDYEVLNAAYNNLLNLSKQINKIDWSNIESITGAFVILDQASALANKLTDAMTGTTDKHSFTDFTEVVCRNATIGCGLGFVAGALGGPFAPITMATGLIGGTIFGGVTGIVEAVKNEMDDSKLKELYKKIQDTTKALVNKQKECEEGLKNKAAESVENIKTKFGDFFGETMDFSGIKSPSELTDKLKSLETCGVELKGYYDLAKLYGIDLSEVEDFMNIMEKLQDTDNPFDQNFIDQYIESLEIETGESCIDDTKNFQELWSEVSTVMQDLQNQGYNIDKFAEFLEEIETKNNESIAAEAETIKGGYDPESFSEDLAGGIGAALGAVNTAKEKYDELLENASSYELNLDPLTKLQEELRQSAQSSVDNYLAGIVTQDLTIEQLDTLYANVQTMQGSLEQYAQQVNLAGFVTKLQEISGARQNIVNTNIQNVRTSVETLRQKVNSAVDNNERYAVLQELTELKATAVAYGIDTSTIEQLENYTNSKMQQANL